MKNLTKIFMAVVAVMLVSCIADTTIDPTVELGNGQTTITLSMGGDSKTHIDGNVESDKYPVYWSEGDKISVNGIVSEEAQIQENNAASATFVINGTPGKPYRIAYPAVEEDNCVKFAAKQAHTDGTFADGVAVMYGYGEEGLGVSMKHLSGVLRFGLVGEADGEGNYPTIVKAQVSTVNRAPIAGKFALDFESGELTATEESTDIISYSFEGGLKLTGEPQFIHVVVPAGVYGNLYVTLYDNAGGYMPATITATDEKPLNPGKIRNYKKVVYQSKSSDYYTIHDYDSLLGFANAINEATEAAPFTKNAILIEDVTIPADAAWTPISGAYTATINGNGYSISGLKAPLFETIQGTVKGLHLLDVDIEETEKLVVGSFARKLVGGSLLNCSASGKLVMNNTTYATKTTNKWNEVNIAGIVGYADAATLDGCVNNVDVAVKSVVSEEVISQKFRVLVAGAVAFVKNGCSLNDIINNGVISWKVQQSTADTHYLSGILARTEVETDLAKITNCTNNGKITVEEGSNRGSINFVMTGVAAYVTAGGTCVVENLTNNAEISDYGTGGNLYMGGVSSLLGVASKTVKNTEKGSLIIAGEGYAQVFAGGIAADMNSNRGNSEDFLNEGAITFSGSSNGAVNIGGVLGRGYKGNTRKNCDNTGDITISGSIASNLIVGGIMTQNNPQVANGGFSECDNSGNIHLTSTSSVGGFTYIGGLCGAFNNSNSSTARNILSNTNSGDITLEGSCTGDVHVGGFGGAHGTCAEYEDCVNSGDITVRLAEQGAAIFVGGLQGSHIAAHTPGKKLSYLRCYNDGVISVDTNSASTIGGLIAIGGLIGHSNHDKNTTYRPKGVSMTDCANRASINLNGPCGGRNIYVAGLFATHYYFFDGTSTFTNCTTTKKNIKGEDNKITVNITNAGTLQLGGASASASEAATTWKGGMQFVDCTLAMDVDITYKANEGVDKDLSIGGVTGYFSPVLHAIQGCKNEANITVKGNGGALYLGGIAGYANTSIPLSLTIDNCTNTGTIKSDIQTLRYNIVAGIVARDKSSRVDNCVNTGTIEMTSNASSGYAAFLSGIHGWEADYCSTITNCKNSGTIKCNAKKVGNTSDTWYYSTLSVGGIIAGNSAAAKDLTVGGVTTKIEADYSNNVNTGKIEIADITIAKNHAIGGIIGYAANHVSNCQSYCELSAIGATNAGMIMGTARAEATLVKNCQVGGQIAVTESEKKTWDDDAEDYIWKTSPDWNPLTNENYFTYIYGGTTDWTGVEAYDGCSWLSEAPAVSAL